VQHVHVLGVGATPFARAGPGAERPAREAAAAALADAGLTASDIGAVVVARGRRGPWGAYGLDPGPRVLGPASASAVTALHLAYETVASGAHDTVLCVGHQSGADAHALPLAALAAAAADYMRASGATERTFAFVAAKNRVHGAANPRSLHPSPVDAREVMRSDVVEWPLRRLMVASPSQGAAAVVLGSARGAAAAPRLLTDVLVRVDPGDTTRDAISQAAGLAYRLAHVGPDDVDCAEVQDLTAADEVAAYEALQFAPEGQGPDLVDSGFTALGGVLPVNTSGGSISQGEATGVSAIAQICELVWQLRGEAAERQVPDARVGLALSTAPDGDGAAHVGLAILRGA
jgi:acetyl-CoA acetyltransferase